MASGAIVGKLADELGMAYDDASTMFDDVSDAEAEKLMDELQGADGIGWRDRAASTFADQPSRIADTGFSTAQTTALGLGGLGAGAFAADRYFDREKMKLKQEAYENQSDALQEIMQDPHLSPEQKQDLINQLTESGFFSGAPEDDSGGDSIFDQIIPSNLGIGETLFALIIVYFVGKALVEASGSLGGGGAPAGGGN